MKSIWQSQIVVVGLAIFSMLFGAGNLIYPMNVGSQAGQFNTIAIIGFLITAVMLPLVGLITIIFFNGNYDEFFERLGKLPAKIMVFFCMLIIGPVIAIPRIVTVSYTMLQPFMPETSIIPFAVIFLGITFLCTYRESKIVDLLGKYISPALVVSLFTIIIVGLFKKDQMVITTSNPMDLFFYSLRTGYETLDLLGSIFFSSIVITLLKKNCKEKYENHPRRLASFGLKAGLFGTTILALIYYGMSLLAKYHSHSMIGINGGEIFRNISLNVLGRSGGLILGVAVLMACFSTAIALAAVVSEYIQRVIFKNRICFVSSLVILLLCSLPLSIKGLDYVGQLTGGPLTYVGYPVLITLTFFNLAHKLWGVTYVKLPVALVGIITTLTYLGFAN
jgi:LIVCS family branched-chain amino acid:cation transporter